MKRHYTAFLIAPNPKNPGTFRSYSHLPVVASSKAEARAIVEQHLADRKPLGFSEAAIRRPNPKQTPWIPGLRVFFILEGVEATEDEEAGIPF